MTLFVVNNAVPQRSFKILTDKNRYSVLLLLLTTNAFFSLQVISILFV